jgi:hypothetical protein
LTVTPELALELALELELGVAPAIANVREPVAAARENGPGRSIFGTWIRPSQPMSDCTAAMTLSIADVIPRIAPAMMFAAVPAADRTVSK